MDWIDAFLLLLCLLACIRLGVLWRSAVRDRAETAARGEVVGSVWSHMLKLANTGEQRPAPTLGQRTDLKVLSLITSKRAGQ